MKKSFTSVVLLVVILAVGGYVTYRYAIKPWLEKRELEKAIDKGCEEVVKKFEAEKEQIAEDLAQLLEKMETEIETAKENTEVNKVELDK